MANPNPNPNPSPSPNPDPNPNPNPNPSPSSNPTPKPGALLSSVVESEPVRDLVGGMERGEVCPDALSPQELSACLMREGRLLRTVTDATCQSLRLGKTECEG